MTARSIDRRTTTSSSAPAKSTSTSMRVALLPASATSAMPWGLSWRSATEETTVFSGSGPVARELARIARSVTRTVTLTLHDISLENLALFTVSEVRRLNAADRVSGEAAILRPGRWHQMGGADRPAGVLKIATPASKTVTATQAIAAGRFGSGASETEQKGQYIVDYARARIFWLPVDHALYEAKAGVQAGTALAIDYTPDDAARDQVQGAFRQLTGAFRYIEDAAEGQGRNIYAPRCSIQPAGGLTLLDGRSSEQQIRLAVSLLEPGGGRPALYIDGQAA